MALSSMDGKNSHLSLTIRDITLIALLAVILFVQEEALTFVPGLQFTVFLLVFYSKKIGFWRTGIIVLVHVFLDNLVMGSFSLIYTPFMFVGWIIIPLTMCTLFRRVENNIILGLLGALYSFIYCWLFFIPDCAIYGIGLIPKFLSDVLFEVLMAVMSFLSLLLLYKPLSKILDPMIAKQINRPQGLDEMSRDNKDNDK